MEIFLLIAIFTIVMLIALGVRRDVTVGVAAAIAVLLLLKLLGAL